MPTTPIKEEPGDLIAGFLRLANINAQTLASARSELIPRRTCSTVHLIRVNTNTDLCNVVTEGAWKTGVRNLKRAAMALRRELDLQGELALA
jgi:hypothetical protein